jgi:hypothetical protein
MSVAFMVAALLTGGYIAAGAAGIMIAGTVLALAGIFVARAGISSGTRPPRAVREDYRHSAGGQDDFPVYLEIAADVTWAGVSLRHYDHGLRPRLARMLEARLAERHGLEVATQPERARELAGAELWGLIDRAGMPSDNHDAPGVSLARLAQVVARLEEL